MNELEHILTEASIEEIDDAIREIDWLCKYDITDRSSDIAIAALKYVRKLKEMDGDKYRKLKDMGGGEREKRFIFRTRKNS